MESQSMVDNETKIIVLGESHFMHGVSTLGKNVNYRIPDSSAIKMALKESENDLLKTDPNKIFNILTKNETVKPNFIISQGKYLHNFDEMLT